MVLFLGEERWSVVRGFFLGLNYEQNELPLCLEPIFLEFMAYITSISLADVLEKKTKAFSKRIANFAQLGQQGDSARTIHFESRYPISPLGALSRAPFIGDLRIKCVNQCSSFHSLNIELCLNNIEAIGTNFLKLETIAESEREVSHHGILVCLTRELLIMGNWDNAYAEDLDYVRAYRLAYQPSLQHRFAVLQISPG